MTIPLKELREALDRSTKGEWKHERISWRLDEYQDTFTYEFHNSERLLCISEANYEEPMRAKFDADFIAIAHNHMGELLDRVDKLTEERESYRYEIWELTNKFGAATISSGHYEDLWKEICDINRKQHLTYRAEIESLEKRLACAVEALEFVSHECMHSEESCPTREHMRIKCSQSLETINAKDSHK